MRRLVLFLMILTLVSLPAVSQKREPGKVKTLVIDPGHGGDKPGAIGKHITEKDLVLDVALKFGALVEKHLPDVNVIYTRKTDVDITLARRAEMANQAKADLFISVHANSHPTGKPKGVETFVMGLSQSKANLEVAKKENADILKEADYQKNSAYQGFDPNSPESYVMFAMYQNAYISKSLDFANYIQKQYSQNLTSTINRGVKQAELFVIYKTAMPAVLTEIGFISNAEEEKFLMTEAGKNKIAMSLYNAFATYKAHEEGTQPKLIKSFDQAPESEQLAEAPAAKDKAAERAAREAEAKERAAREAEEKAQAAREAELNAQAEREAAEAEAKAREEAAKALAAAESKAQAERAAAEKARKESEQKQQQPAESAPVVEEKPAPSSEKPAAEAKPRVVFKVQFLRSDKLLKAGDKELKGLDNFTYYQNGNVYCYMWGESHSIEAAKGLQSDVRAKGFKDAFVVAFANGERISVQKARELLSEEQ